MPPLQGFSNNVFESREDVIRAAEALIKPLMGYMSPNKGRVKIPHATGTHFDEVAAQLEGFARPLWAVGALIMGGYNNPDLIDPWIDGLTAGIDPENEDYWGPIEAFDQRMVEAEMISFLLLAAPDNCIWNRLGQESQQHLINWLSRFHIQEMHKANWLWFRVFANLALLKACGVDTPVIKLQVQQDLECLDSFYMTDGWSSDGLWRSQAEDDEEFNIFQKTGQANTVLRSRNADYYSGSFAIQFSQLLYVRFAADLDPERTERYREQARNFGAGFCRYFDSAGAPIPFGRSLTYRFACGGYFAALAVAKVPNMPEPLSRPGAAKGFLLRHLRWWASHSTNIFSTDGTLNLGWVYPQMYLTENYNSPQSVYWALKSLIVVGLTADDAFWTEREGSPPKLSSETALRVLPGPRHIVCNHPEGNHHFLLSSAQFISIPFKGAAAKYSKFAYSSAFGFSVPSGNYGLAQLAPDSTLAFSRDGMETWAVKYRSLNVEFKEVTVFSASTERVPAATVTWFPWADRNVSVDTTLIPPTTRWPDWHIRIHRIRARGGSGRLFTVEGGFSIHGRQKGNSLSLTSLEEEKLNDESDLGVVEGIIETDESVLILSEQGASGIVTSVLNASYGTTRTTPFKPEPNTNLMRQRTLIPIIERDILELKEDSDLVFVTKVFAISTEANGGWVRKGKGLRARWLDQPEIQVGNQKPSHDFIIVEY